LPNPQSIDITPYRKLAARLPFLLGWACWLESSIGESVVGG
jgi:hypothetical protein